MKLTIIREDGCVYKDGIPFHGLDLSSAPHNVHALQWDTSSGWIEFVNESEFRKPPNERIEKLPSWAGEALSKWQAAFDAMNAPAPEQAMVNGAQTL